MQVVRNSSGLYTPDTNNSCVWWMELEELDSGDYQWNKQRTQSRAVQRPLYPSRVIIYIENGEQFTVRACWNIWEGKRF